MAPKSKEKEKQRALKAVKEMKSCGFPIEKTKSILKELLKASENNWDFIENENYSVLVDALIASTDTDGPEEKVVRQEVDPQEDDDAVGAVLHRKKRKLNSSSIVESDTQDTLVLGCTLSPAEGAESSGLGKKGKKLAVSPRPKESGESGCDGPGSPRIEPPIAIMIPSATCEGTSGSHVQTRRNTNGIRLLGPCIGSDGKNSAGCSNSVEIASSPNGKVKLSISWSAEGNFQMPKLETIMKMVEDKCLKAYKLLQPKCSLRGIMTEICQAAQQLGQQKDNRSSVNGLWNTETTQAQNIHSLSLIAVRHEPALGDVRPVHDLTDITKGYEANKISVASDLGHSNCPPSFSYISHSIVYQNGHVNFSLARIGDEDCCSECFGNCFSASIPCTCARETGGEFAYTIDGLLTKKFLDGYIANMNSPQRDHLTYCKDCPLERLKNKDVPNPCKGHLVRKFIKECWIKCGCHKQCGNRVVQRGITRNLQVFFTGDSKGWGLRTLEELPRGAFICEYIGEVLTNTELDHRNKENFGNSKHTYPVLLDADWNSEEILKDDEALCLDATFYGNVARFINHRCNDAVLTEIPVEIETADRHYYHLAFFTTRKVEALEELTWDYGIDFDDKTHVIESFACKCGSRYCRDMKKSSKSKRKAVLK